ncbi:MAG: hypothetical protein B7Z55_00110 [Planctomycetales bacterium 12-60-4]|nr:MAG: hypothetical protein B7Z55_00110 [Planctomycetales bacterium 12-60-4]
MLQIPKLPPDAAPDHGTADEVATDFGKLPQLIADGEIPFPMDRQIQERRRLAVLVRQRRRQRLIDYLAQQIARAILADGEPS